MLFLNPWLLAGLAAASIPVILHLVRQRAAKPVDWGAMRFLFDTLSVRRRKMEWEDLLLMSTRCLLLALLALALARPFIPPDSSVPWLFVLPAGLLGVALFGGSFVVGNAKVRWLIRLLGVAMLMAAAGLVVLEKFFNLKRFEASSRRDVALVIDASASMEVSRNGKTVFERALEEARQLVKEAPTGTAFSVILGGPAPEAKTSMPLTHRADVLGVLEQLQPIGGSFRAHEALGLATLGLAQGSNTAKEIIVFTDSQRAGWRFDHPAAWDELVSAWKALPSMPKLSLRDFGTPESLRNLAISQLEVSRGIIGTDRELQFRVTVENTGRVDLTPAPLIVECDGVSIGETPVGLVQGGQSVTVEVTHRFTRVGPQVIQARLDANDDLPADDRLERVVVVRHSLPVLLVDGNPTGSYLDRAAGYAALALAPTGGMSGEDKFLMDPRVVAASALTESDLNDCAVVILADVPRLPERFAATLATKIANGAGLIVLAGPRSDSAFYNTWEGADGPLIPLPLGPEGADVGGISPALSTFGHEALQWVDAKSDLSGAIVKRWRKSGNPVAGAVQGAAFSNGDAFVASRAYGRGRSLIATCAFDARAGNLPARRAFVPLVHELVQWAAGGGVELNVASAWSPRFVLESHSGGLSASYFSSRDSRGAPQLEQIDPAIDFIWPEGTPAPSMPRENFAIHWSGQLVPPLTGDYLLEIEADDRIEVKLGDQAVVKARTEEIERWTVPLEGGKPLPVNIQYEQDGGRAYARWWWTPPGGKRQVIPASAFTPARPTSPIALTAVGPQGLPRRASIQPGRRGRELSIEGSAQPGVYQVAVGHLLDHLLPGINAGTLPVSITRDPAESLFEPMTAGDLTLIRNRIDLLQPRSVVDLLGILEGKGFGREIWKLLALAAFGFFLLESFLARWVSRSRRTAEEVRVEFGETTIWR
jgi:hypothetical protein